MLASEKKCHCKWVGFQRSFSVLMGVKHRLSSCTFTERQTVCHSRVTFRPSGSVNLCRHLVYVKWVLLSTVFEGRDSRTPVELSELWSWCLIGVRVSWQWLHVGSMRNISMNLLIHLESFSTTTRKSAIWNKCVPFIFLGMLLLASCSYWYITRLCYFKLIFSVEVCNLVRILTNITFHF